MTLTKQDVLDAIPRTAQLIDKLCAQGVIKGIDHAVEGMKMTAANAARKLAAMMKRDSDIDPVNFLVEEIRELTDRKGRPQQLCYENRIALEALANSLGILDQVLGISTDGPGRQA